MLPPDTAIVRAFLARAARRVMLLAVAQGAAAGLLAGGVLLWIGVPERARSLTVMAFELGLVVVGVALRLVLSRRPRAAVAALVESRAPQCRNLVVTADELLSHPDRASAPVIALVCRQAAAVVQTLEPSRLFPAQRAMVALTAGGALWMTALTFAATPNAPLALPVPPASDIAVIEQVESVVTPPAYSGRPSRSARDPQRLDALAGSRVHLTIHARAASVHVETIGGVQTLSPSRHGVFTADVAADADGFIAIAPVSATGKSGARALIGLSVTPDHAPRVRITAPGHDLFLATAKRSLDLAVDADDDLGLAALSVRYTKVSGSGERFTFTEGTVPIALTRTDDRDWKATAKWNLESLGLSPGDMVVYRAVVQDRRPGAPAVESDSYITEILAPGGDAAAGFAIDTDQERYALSQQMVILKTEKLAARKSTLATDDLADEALQIAVEQRRVRAEFVFMMGGELADDVTADAGMGDLNEEAEAEGESDIAAGRLANQGRIALVRAIRSMSQASAHLSTVDLARALTSERAALKQLERAFAHTRILLRALTERERLDLSRRLTGTLTDAGRSIVAIPTIDENLHLTALREVLARLAEISAHTLDARAPTSAASAQVTELAVRVLRVDASSSSLKPVVASLQSAATAFGRTERARGRQLLDEAATALTRVVRTEVGDSPRPSHDPEFNRLNGAVSDAARSPAAAIPSGRGAGRGVP